MPELKIKLNENQIEQLKQLFGCSAERISQKIPIMMQMLLWENQLRSKRDKDKWNQAQSEIKHLSAVQSTLQARVEELEGQLKTLAEDNECIVDSILKVMQSCDELKGVTT